MNYAVQVNVSGGVTGNRVALMKDPDATDDSVKTYPDEASAQSAALELTARAKENRERLLAYCERTGRPPSTNAQYTYSVRKLP